jgi:CheY-specific phosphatase CheX
MKPNETQVRSVVRSVWSTQLGLEIRDTDVPGKPAPSPTMTAVVHISGENRGGIRLECSRALVRRAGSIMFNLPADQISEEDERDVVGELTNVIAGNIKALIPGSSLISLPTIVEGTDYKVSTVNVKSSTDFGFTLDGDSMTVTIFEHG